MADTAVLNLGINTKQFHRGLKNAGSDLQGFSKMAIGGFALVGAAIVGGLGIAGVSLIKLASDAQETENKFNAVFSGLQKTANETSKELAKSFGLSSQESQKLLGNTGDLLTGFGFTQKSALDLSTQVQELAGDLASFQNVDATRASESITKALLGETESMKSLGVVVRQNTEEFRNSVKLQMTQTGATEQQAKAMVIFKQITDQSKNAVGDYAKTSKQLANQLKLTGKIWDDLTVGVGSFLMEVTGAEGATLSFNDAFRNMTDNLLGYLKNWKQNWSILKNWISDNIITIFTVDLPNAISLYYKNMINNTAVTLKIFADLWVTFQGWWIGFVGRLFSGDMNNALLESLTSMFTSMTNWARDVWNNLVSIFKGDSGTVFKDFASKANKGIQAGLTGEGLFDALGDVLKEGADRFKGPFEGFKTATTKLEFLKYVPKDLAKSADDLNKALAPVDEKGQKAGVKSKSTKATKTSGSPVDAVLKDSAQAFQIQYGNANELIQKDQLKFQKKIANNTSKLGTQTFNVASFA